MPQLTLAYRDACDVVTLLTNLSSTLRTTQSVAQLLENEALPEKIELAIPRLERTVDGFSNLLGDAGILPPSAWQLGDFAPAATAYDYQPLALSDEQYTEVLFLLTWAIKASELDLAGAPAIVHEPLAYYGQQAKRLLHNLASAIGGEAYQPAPELEGAAPAPTPLPKLTLAPTYTLTPTYTLAPTYTLTLRTHQAVALARELGASAALFGQVVRDGKRRLRAQPGLAPLLKQLEGLHARLLAAAAPYALALAYAGVLAPAKAASADPFQEYSVTFAGPDLQQLVLALEYLRKTYLGLPGEGQLGQLTALMLEVMAPLKPATEQFYAAAALAGFPLAAVCEYVG